MTPSQCYSELAHRSSKTHLGVPLSIWTLAALNGDSSLVAEPGPKRKASFGPQSSPKSRPSGARRANTTTSSLALHRWYQRRGVPQFVSHTIVATGPFSGFRRSVSATTKTHDCPILHPATVNSRPRPNA
ncbi:hypothetical protein NLG97_g1959 [Lecanicillium saksenae]|uniref:Uncharacterized protein n=1 Tax=Lecanicillium saksenae TaxID=468837 RepID=A0ACC1R2C0_9HYPO|nr:hypothetical protein NLG97_g1959 [Lecanicillium saksenae]